ncbi:glutamyl-tRNA reductase [Saprospiraceae bacterium]|jgi:glutamyl-tRNA reductase|nr:glutamyl-tRNA reductase [Saprospiraceae bacterium]
MPKGFHILTVTHKQTNLNKIGAFVIPNAEGEVLKSFLENLKVQFNLKELMYVPTCNRVIYFLYTHSNVDEVFITDFFQTINPTLNAEFIGEEVVHYMGYHSLEHLFRVSSSVESLVVGEREILRQLREGYDKSLNWNLTGHNIRLAMDGAVIAAKDVYSNTRIGEKPVSVVSLAIEQLMKCELPTDARILMVGAGQTNNLVTKFLVKYNYSNVTIFNRTIEKAQNIATRLNGTALSLSDLENHEGGFDCMIVCTGATQAIINKDLYQKLLNGETTQKVVIDLAIPNNVEADVVEHFNVNHIEIDGLKLLAKENLAFRQKEVTKVEVLLERHLEEFEITYRQRQITRAMQNVPTEIKAVKEHAMTEVFKKDIESLDENARLLLERMMTYMEKKCIGIPMKAAKSVAS